MIPVFVESSYAVRRTSDGVVARNTRKGVSLGRLSAELPPTSATDEPFVDVSFIILAWNSETYLERCLGSISSAMSRVEISYEVLVLDNGSRDGTTRVLERLAAADPEHVRPQYRRTNLGTTKSRNLLCRAAIGDYLCVMDSDVELPAGVVETLLDHLRRDPRLGIVVPKIIYPSGTWQKSFDRFPTVLDKIDRFFRLRRIEAQQGAQVGSITVPFHIDYAISAFWLMPRSLFAGVGMLDERIFYAPEDVDLCLRIWRAGHRILYIPSVSIVHHTQELSRGFKLNRAKLSHIKGLAYYFLKHRYLFRRPSFASALN